MCFLGFHFWKQLNDDWGIRICRICSKKEKAMYDSTRGIYWVEC